MTPEQKHEHRRAQKRASYARRAADPRRRAELNAYSRQQWAAKHGPSKRADLSGLTPEEKHARKLAQQRESRARRNADPAQHQRIKARETTEQRVAYKREWQRAHAAKLNARRQRARLTNPQKYREQEKAAKQRCRLAKQKKPLSDD